MQQDDEELASLSKSGDITSFNRLVERYQEQVFNLTARILGDRAAAEDVTQESFISGHRAIRRFRGGSFRAWLIRIASNQSYDYIRASQRRREDSLDRSLGSPGFTPPATDASPETDALRGELRAAIERAILSLPPDQRTVLALVDVQGFSYDEAAQAAAISVGTVKSRMSRARARVRDLLAEQRELLPEEFRQKLQGSQP